jgi:hypothetical protein
MVDTILPRQDWEISLVPVLTGRRFLVRHPLEFLRRGASEHVPDDYLIEALLRVSQPQQLAKAIGL